MNKTKKQEIKFFSDYDSVRSIIKDMSRHFNVQVSGIMLYLRILKEQYDEHLYQSQIKANDIVLQPERIADGIYRMDDDTWNIIYRRASLPDSQKPCDKTSHERHIPCDTVSHIRMKSCLSCIHFEPTASDDDGERYFCHHDSVKRVIESTVRNCPLHEAYDGTVSS